MTRTHAAYQLLRHGPLDLGEFQEITGWKYKACVWTLSQLRDGGRVRLASRGAGDRNGNCVKRSVYEAVQ
jgi:hypothetical protein